MTFFRVKKGSASQLPQGNSAIVFQFSKGSSQKEIHGLTSLIETEKKSFADIIKCYVTLNFTFTFQQVAEVFPRYSIWGNSIERSV